MRKQSPTLCKTIVKASPLLKRQLILILALIGLFSTIARGQESRPSASPVQITEVKAFLSKMKLDEQNSRGSNATSSHLESLINDVQPAIYITSGTVKSYGDNPTVLYSDLSSLSNGSLSAIVGKTIEILTIKISSRTGLSGSIDLSLLERFPNLKYVYIISEVQSTEGELIKMLQNNNVQYSVFYKIEKGA